MAAWSLSSLRHMPVVPSFAKYHSVPNEVSAPPLWGIDMFSIATSIVAIFAYIPSSYAIDRFGLVSTIAGSFLVAICTWVRYMAKKNITIAVLSVAAQALFGPLISTSLLAISNRWYPPRERVKATTVGSLLGALGSGLAFILPSQFRTYPHEVVDFTLKSCKSAKVAETTRVVYEARRASNQTLICTGKHLAARDHFCCYLPLDIDRLNLVVALVASCTFLFSAVAVRNLPPTPPAASGKQASYAGMWTSVKQCFRNQRFTKLSLSDGLVSGPPALIASTIARIFPSSIAHLSVIAFMLGMTMAVPATLATGHFLDRTKAYWSFTFAGYTLGTVFWAIATICIASGTLPGAYVFMGSMIFAMAVYICWQAAVFETKLEYVFDAEKQLEGVIVAADRIIMNLSSLVFLAAIPPERVGGAKNTFYIGLVVMVLGCVPTALIKDRFRYLRLAYDAQQSSIDAHNNDLEVYRPDSDQE